MFNLIQSTPMSGDCTCGYIVDLHNDYTVNEFIQEVLTEHKKEWGCFRINEGVHRNRGIRWYRYGRLESGMIPEELLDMKIEKVTARGGWSAMDYTITI